MDDNSLDIELAKSVGVFFRLTDKEMDAIIDEVYWQAPVNGQILPDKQTSPKQNAK